MARFTGSIGRLRSYLRVDEDVNEKELIIKQNYTIMIYDKSI